MPTFATSSARFLAFRILQDIERIGALADETINRALATVHIDPRDRALTVELVYGVLRHRGTLDWRLDHVSDRPMERLPLPIRTALRLGSYQLLYLERIPASAAVNESVLLAKTVRGRDWSGFVNAILRTLQRTDPLPWPDPAKDPADAYTVRYACPRWLVERWIAGFGTDGAERLCQATVRVPPLTLRVNTQRFTRDELQDQFLKAGVESQPTVVSPVGIVLEKQGAITDLPLFNEGAFYVEDEAAQLVPPLLDAQPGERILDACAAPGGKATHLAAIMHNRGEIMACDQSRSRLRLLEQNCRRLGVSIVTPVEIDAARLDDSASSRNSFFSKPFDRILVDAPCSGFGVLRRHPEGKWLKHEDLLQPQQTRQLAILAHVGPLLRPGGIIVYSTCSTEIEENEQVIERFCSGHPDFSREAVLPWLPIPGRSLVNPYGDLSTMFAPHSLSMDGFFAARLRKAA
ncbi:MAG TPA: 16S rRNA (cytosine(967)-C(5))-methyltransferase RsmB [Nitrospiraceae bacterium]|nr:16S rRNA (cytosine(967)-C(5))-methyltransferase RsmB [Nitrospiraceae bacterium]